MVAEDISSFSSIKQSAFVGIMGSSTIYQRIQKGSCLADLLGNVHTDLGPGCGFQVICESVLAPLDCSLGAPREH